MGGVEHLRRARDEMDRRYAEPLDIAALAATALASEAHFIRSFKREFGETPHRYLQRRRIERAATLLRETDRTVTEISLDVGFQRPQLVHDRVPGDHGRDADRLPRPPARRAAGDGPGLLHDDVDAKEQFSASRMSRARHTVRPMITKLSHATIWVLDQDEALTFYRDKLGFEVRTDQTMDSGFRWLTVGPPGRTSSSC